MITRSKNVPRLTTKVFSLLWQMRRVRSSAPTNFRPCYKFGGRNSTIPLPWEANIPESSLDLEPGLHCHPPTIAVQKALAPDDRTNILELALRFCLTKYIAFHLRAKPATNICSYPLFFRSVFLSKWRLIRSRRRRENWIVYTARETGAFNIIVPIFVFDCSKRAISSSNLMYLHKWEMKLYGN